MGNLDLEILNLKQNIKIIIKIVLKITVFFLINSNIQKLIYHIYCFQLILYHQTKTKLFITNYYLFKVIYYYLLFITKTNLFSKF